MSLNNQEKKKEFEPEIRKPSSSGFRRFNFESGDYTLKHSRRQLWQFLLKFLLPHKNKFLLFMVLLLFGTVFMSYSPLLSASIIDRGIIGRDMDYLFIMAIVYLCLMILMATFSFVAQYGMGRVSQNVVFSVRNDLFYKLQDMSLTFFDKRPSGDIISILTNDIDQLNLLVGGQFVQIINSIVSIVLSIIFMYLLNPLLATIGLVVFPIFYIMTSIFKKVILKAFTESRKSISKVTSSIQENIAGAKVVQAFAQEEKASTEFDVANTENYNIMLRVRRIMASFMPFIGFVSTILTAVVILVGSLTVLNNISIFGISVTIGVLSAFVSILAQFFQPFMTIAMIQQIIESAMAASDRIYSLLEESVEIPDPKDPVELEEDVKGEVIYEEVSFGYRFDGKNGDANSANSKMASPMGDMGMMAQNPMIKRAFKMMKSFPEPYSSFLLKNITYMPQEIRQKLFMNLMRTKPENGPKIIDKILAESKYAVPNTKIAEKYPEYRTTFKTKGSRKKRSSFEQMMPPETILMMIKGLERMLNSKANLQQSGGSMGGSEGGMMGAGMSRMSPEVMLRTLATIPIPKDIEEKIPPIVKEAIEEQKKLIEHEQSMGYVLEDVSFEVSAGTTLALVGETGAGKTTVIKLLSRFYDINSGTIQIDGVDIREVTKKVLRDLIGLVPQDAFIFTGTIRENLLYAYEEPTPELETKMIEISNFLGLHNFIETLPKKYDTVLRENGSNISIGQRQLISFARALITDPKILILDEATSSVDPYTELLIQDALNKARKGRTTIIIAHRLSTIKNADHIIVLGKEKHGVIEEGTHEQLINLNGGKYKRLLEMQKKDIKI